MVILLHDRLASALGPLAHGLAGLDGVVLEVDGAYGRVHGAEEEQQVRAALGTQEPLELLDGEHGVGLRAVMEVVGHLGHVPRHGPAHGDADGLAGRGRGASGDLQETGDGQDADEHLVGKHVFGDNKKNTQLRDDAIYNSLRACGGLLKSWRLLRVKSPQNKVPQTNFSILKYCTRYTENKSSYFLNSR